MRKCVDLTGIKFGRLLAMNKTSNRTSSGVVIWECLCDCGKVISVSSTSLKSGHTKSCGCYKRDTQSESFTKNLIGEKFGKLLVVEKGFIKNGLVHWMCKCDCGSKKIISGLSLRRGLSKSCGCLQLEVATKHGLSQTSFYDVWDSMKQRCLNKRDRGYSYYGGRGIKICDRWLESFENFKEDMYESYLKHIEEFGEKQTTIDRINVNGNYAPENCRWATWKEQRNNQRDYSTQKQFKAISPDGIEYTSNNQMKFARVHDLYSTGINMCLKNKIRSCKGWKFEYVESSLL